VELDNRKVNRRCLLFLKQNIFLGKRRFEFFETNVSCKFQIELLTVLRDMGTAACKTFRQVVISRYGTP